METTLEEFFSKHGLGNIFSSSQILDTLHAQGLRTEIVHEYNRNVRNTNPMHCPGRSDRIFLNRISLLPKDGNLYIPISKVRSVSILIGGIDYIKLSEEQLAIAYAKNITKGITSLDLTFGLEPLCMFTLVYHVISVRFDCYNDCDDDFVHRVVLDYEFTAQAEEQTFDESYSFAKAKNYLVYGLTVKNTNAYTPPGLCIDNTMAMGDYVTIYESVKTGEIAKGLFEPPMVNGLVDKVTFAFNIQPLLCDLHRHDCTHTPYITTHSKESPGRLIESLTATFDQEGQPTKQTLEIESVETLNSTTIVVTAKLSKTGVLDTHRFDKISYQFTYTEDFPYKEYNEVLVTYHKHNLMFQTNGMAALRIGY